jgi:ABC-type sugar transport system, permease component
MKIVNEIKYGRISQFILIVVLLLIAVFMLLPFFWVFATSLRLPRDSFKMPPSFFPTKWNWANYLYVFTAVPFGRFIFNSLFVTITITIVQLIFAAMAAYAFARFNFKGKNILFIYVLTGLMIPFQSICVAQFFLISKMGLVNTLTAIILPYFASSFSIFLMRQFMQTIPRSYDEAALIDGANRFQIFWRVILPMSVPSLMVCGFMTFIAQWNNFFTPLIYLDSQNNYTLPMGMKLLSGHESVGSLSVIFAGVILSLIVPAIVYCIGQKYLIQGTVLSGVKS